MLVVDGWWSVRWSVMEREFKVTTRISHPLFQQVALTVKPAMWTGSGRSKPGLRQSQSTENKWARPV